MENTEQIFYSEEAREKLKTGINKAAKAVAATYGAMGRNVSILHKGVLSSTKDGVTVARHIFLPDRAENAGAMMVKEAAGKTLDLAGDGTSVTTILLRAFVETPSSESNPVALTRQINKAVEEAVAALKTIAKPVESLETLKRIASISANNDPSIGDVVAETVWKVGKDGVVLIEKGTDTKTTTRVAEGIRFMSGLVSPAFINNGDKNRCDLNESVVVLSERPVVKYEELIPVADYCVRNGLGLIIIAPDIEQAALGFLAKNAMEGKLNCAAIKSPGQGEITNDLMQDIAIMVGGVFIKQSAGAKIHETDPAKFGRVKNLEANMIQTTLKDGFGRKEKVNERVAQLKSQLKDETSEDEISVLKERIASLQNGIAVITVGGITPTEIKEKTDRFDDSVRASISALEEGYVAGGGVGFLQMASKITVDTEGARLLRSVLMAPSLQLLSNCGTEVDASFRDGIGYNALTDEWVDMIDAGIIDPAKVVRVSLQHAASTATTYFTTEAFIVL
jgi:chaperonin GroEL